MSTPTNAELLDNIVQVLCTAEAFWPSGCCVYNLAAGQTEAQLQVELQLSFPANGWDNLAQLEAILEYGRKRGVLKQYANPLTGQVQYFLLLEMVRLNPLNEIYRTTCPTILPLPPIPPLQSAT